MAELQEQQRNPEQGDKKTLRIIHIEDQERIRHLSSIEFKNSPDVELVASFSSTEEAEEYLIKLKNEKKDLPDIIISDNSLGVGRRRGIQFAIDLKKQGFEVPVVLFTSDAEQFSKQILKGDLNRMGVKSIVDKNIEVKDLVEILKQVSLNKPLD